MSVLGEHPRTACAKALLRRRWLAFFLGLVVSVPCSLAHESLLRNIKAVTTAIEQEPENAALYLRRAELHRLHRDWAAARSDLQHAASLSGDPTMVDLYLGRLFLDEGQPDRAVELLSRYLEQEPRQTVARVSRARALASVLAGGDADHAFVTAPPGTGVDPVRIWVIGDSGTAHQQQLNPLAGEVRDAQGVRDAYFRYGGLGTALVTAGAIFSYLDDGSDQGSAWRELGFDDSGWSAGPGDATTLAPTPIGGTNEHIYHRTAVDPSLLVDGMNVLAVEVHQRAPQSSDISLHAELFAQTGAGIRTDLFLMAGDNAYNVGTEDEWQRAVFDPHATALRNTVLWPVLGNHDIFTLDGVPIAMC